MGIRAVNKEVLALLARGSDQEATKWALMFLRIELLGGTCWRRSLKVGFAIYSSVIWAKS
jgi:hypothetical protein